MRLWRPRSYIFLLMAGLRCTSQKTHLLTGKTSLMALRAALSIDIVWAIEFICGKSLKDPMVDLGSLSGTQCRHSLPINPMIT